MMWKQFTAGRIGDTVEMNFDSCFAEFRAEVNDLNTTAAGAEEKVASMNWRNRLWPLTAATYLASSSLSSSPENKPTWSPSVYRFRGARVNLLPLATSR
jgi:hypothetical protein